MGEKGGGVCVCVREVGVGRMTKRGEKTNKPNHTQSVVFVPLVS